jgi:hypothetical protein
MPGDREEDRMDLTKSFSRLVQKRIARDPAFGDALLGEGIDTTLDGDVVTDTAILRGYIKPTLGIEKVGEGGRTMTEQYFECPILNSPNAFRACHAASTGGC